METKKKEEKAPLPRRRRLDNVTRLGVCMEDNCTHTRTERTVHCVCAVGDMSQDGGEARGTVERAKLAYAIPQNVYRVRTFTATRHNYIIRQRGASTAWQWQETHRTDRAYRNELNQYVAIELRYDMFSGGALPS